MTRFKWGLFLALIGLLGAALPVLAQATELTESYTFASSGAAFQYAPDWELQEDGGLVTLITDFGMIYMQDAVGLEALGVTVSAEVALRDGLRSYFDAVYGGQVVFNARGLRTTKLEEREATSYSYRTPEGEDGLMLAVRFSDGLFGVVDAVGIGVKLTGAPREAVEAVALSFDSTGQPAGGLTAGGLDLSKLEQPGGAATPTPAAPAVEPTPAPPAAPAQDCVVSAPRGAAVSVRVGPGLNRGAYATLPTGRDFVVLGKTTLDDGSVWYKLDKNEVAPNKAAEESWIAAADVDAAGGCDAVVDAAAPPIVGGIVPGRPGRPGAASGSEITPQAGTYTMRFTTVLGSCGGGNTVTLNISIPSVSAVLRVNPGVSVTLDGNTLSRIATNTYVGNGTITVDGQRVRARVAMLVTSPTSMQGDMQFTFDNDNCRATVGYAMSR